MAQNFKVPRVSFSIAAALHCRDVNLKLHTFDLESCIKSAFGLLLYVDQKIYPAIVLKSIIQFKNLMICV